MTISFLVGAGAVLHISFLHLLNLHVSLTKCLPCYLHLPDEQMKVQGC